VSTEQTSANVSNLIDQIVHGMARTVENAFATEAIPDSMAQGIVARIEGYKQALDDVRKRVAHRSFQEMLREVVEDGNDR
jgi:hypothetical protein